MVGEQKQWMNQNNEWTKTMNEWMNFSHWTAVSESVVAIDNELLSPKGWWTLSPDISESAVELTKTDAQQHPKNK